jgi:hypothetical protein
MGTWWWGQRESVGAEKKSEMGSASDRHRLTAQCIVIGFLARRDCKESFWNRKSSARSRADRAFFEQGGCKAVAGDVSSYQSTEVTRSKSELQCTPNTIHA